MSNGRRGRYWSEVGSAGSTDGHIVAGSIPDEVLAELDATMEEDRVMFTDYNYLHGFWRETESKPSPVRLVAGDREKFAHDLELCKVRNNARLDAMERNRYAINYSYPEEYFTVDEWCGESLDLLVDEEGSE